MNAVRMAAGFVLAVLVAAALASLVQTQYALGALAGLGVPVDAATRLDATLHDLRGFAPLYALVAALAMGLAFPLAALVARRRGRGHVSWHTVAGAAAIATALGAMLLVMPVTPIAALRHLSAYVLMSLAGALGGAIYALVYRPAAFPTRARGTRAERADR